MDCMLLRDNPNENETAILDIYVREANAINVLVGTSIDDTFTYIPPLTTSPTFSDPAGTNARNPQSSNVSVNHKPNLSIVDIYQYSHSWPSAAWVYEP